jgi:hypothetical protein
VPSPPFLFDLATSYPPHAGALHSERERERERERESRVQPLLSFPLTARSGLQGNQITTIPSRVFTALSQLTAL